MTWTTKRLALRGCLLLVSAALVLVPVVVAAQPAPLPKAAIGRSAYAPFEPLIGRTWRGKGTGPEAIEDIQRWDFAIGGHAVRVVHSVGEGVYAGETLIFRDRDSGGYIFHYFTTAGFHTTGTITVTGPTQFDIDETVHGAAGIRALRSKTALDDDGIYRTRSRVEKDGAWVEAGGFDYHEDAMAPLVLPPVPEAVSEQSVTAGTLSLSRRIVRRAEAGGDVAAYVQIVNSGAADRLLSVTCACAETVDFHAMEMSETGMTMSSHDGMAIPEKGRLDIRPGSDLHLMLMNFAPQAPSVDTVSMTLTFEKAGPVAADFRLTYDTDAAWKAHD